MYWFLGIKSNAAKLIQFFAILERVITQFSIF